MTHNGSHAPDAKEERASMEVRPAATRRTFSAAYRREIVELAATLTPSERGALLRREGLDSSHLARWKAELRQGGIEARRRPRTADVERQRRTKPSQCRLDSNHDAVYAPCMPMTLKQIKFDDDDLKAVEAVQRMYGCDSFSQAVRLAARMAAQSQRAVLPVPPSPKFSNARRTLSSVEGMIQLPDGMDTDVLDTLLSEAAGRYRFAWRDPSTRASKRASQRGQRGQRGQMRASGKAKTASGDA